VIKRSLENVTCVEYQTYSLTTVCLAGSPQRFGDWYANLCTNTTSMHTLAWRVSRSVPSIDDSKYVNNSRTHHLEWKQRKEAYPDLASESRRVKIAEARRDPCHCSGG